MAATVVTTVSGISVHNSMRSVTPLSTGKRTRAACTMQVDEPSSFSMVEVTCGSMGVSAMQGYKELLASKQFIDLVVIVNGSEFDAHKVIMAGASSHFR